MLHFFSIVTGIISGSFIFYSIYYFEIEPKYQCKNDVGVWIDCIKTEFCIHDKVDPSVTFRINNDPSVKVPQGWIEQYSLYCQDNTRIGLIGSSFFIGCFIGSFILPRLADQVGRKPMFMLGLIINVFATVGLYFGRTSLVLYLFLILGGIGETGRYYVAYVYAVEIFTEKQRNAGGLFIFMLMAIAKVGICLYFMLSVAKDWKMMCYMSWLFSAIAFTLVFCYVQESPRFQLAKGQYEKVKQTVRLMDSDIDNQVQADNELD